MAGIAYATTLRPTVPLPSTPLVGTEVTWQGWDNSLWELTNPESGVVLVNQGVEGLHLPKFRQWTRQSPAVAGQTFAGSIAEPRTVVLPLLVFQDASSSDWVDHDRKFWRSLHPAREGTLTVSPAGIGYRRSLRCRLVPEDHSFALDPAFAQWAQYVVTLVADQPFWAGPPVQGGWIGTGGDEFYEETGPHLVNIASGYTTADASIKNDGDEDAWPVWTIIGPATSAHVGVGDNVLEIPFEVEAGKAVVIDTDPRVQTAIEYDYTEVPGGYFQNPVDRTADLTGSVDFAAIPAGGRVPINIAITGGGTIRVKVTPLYWRAW